MDLLNSHMLETIINNSKRKSEGLLPELVKRLILSSVEKITSIRIPSKDDVWAPGFDGIVDCDEDTVHICSGRSVWEFGTNNDTLGKINDDYAKRTKDSLGIKKDETAFYLVVPKIWSFQESISNWETNHKGEWARVHIIDASELCDWINSLPSVCSWLFENYYDEEILSFTSISKAWERFKCKTEPNLSLELFLADRQKETKFINANHSKSIIRIQSNSFVDSVGFTLASILQNKENREAFIAVEDEITFKQLNRIVKEQTFVFTFHCDSDINLEHNNSVILCFSDADISIRPDIKLNKISKKSFEDALKNMGITDINASRFSKYTDRSVTALVRKIPGNANITKPKWAVESDMSYLIPIIFMRKINRESMVDRSIVELFGINYKEFENKINAVAKLEDRPVKTVERYYSIIHYEEVWLFLQLNTSDSCYKILVDLIIAAISVNSLKPLAKDYDVSVLQSVNGGLLSNLLTNLVYFSTIGESDRQRVVRDIEKILKEMVKANRWNVLLANLSILANAAPRIIMEFINANIEKGGFIDLLFSNQDYSNDYCKILWALETLMKFDECKFDACIVLKELYLRGYNYRIVNSPKDTLLNALCLWNTNNALQLKDKQNIILLFMEENPVQMSLFALELLGKNNYSCTVNLEEFQSDVHNNTEITYGELFNVVNTVIPKIVDIIIETGSTEILSKFIDSYHLVNIEIYEDLIHRIDCSIFDAEHLQKVYFNILLQIRRFKIMYHHRKSDIYKKYVDVFKKLSEKIQSPNLLLRYSSYFQNWWDCPLLDEDDINQEIDYVKENEQKFEYRKQIYYLLKEEYGENVYCQLLDIMSDDKAWGKFLIQIDSGIDNKELCEKCVERSKKHILLSVLELLKLDEFTSIFVMFHEDLKIEILSQINREDILSLLDTTEKEQAYWGNKQMAQYDSVIYKKLLRYNPMGLINFYAYNNFTKDNIDDVVRVLERIKELEIDVRQVPNGDYMLNRLFGNIDELTYSEKIACLEFDFYYRHQIEDFLEGMKKFYFFNPHKIVEQFNNECTKYQNYFKLAYKFSLPQIAYTEFKRFEFFFDSLIDNANDKDFAYGIVGQILGRSICGNDKIFPHEFSRRIIEKYASEKLNRDFIIGKSNADGFHMRLVGDGSDQIAIAKELQDNANSICLEFPITAQLLRELSEQHIREARMDREWSEIDVN